MRHARRRDEKVERGSDKPPLNMIGSNLLWRLPRHETVDLRALTLSRNAAHVSGMSTIGKQFMC